MLSLESRRAAKIAENAILLDKLQIKHHAERLRADASVTAGANANAVKKRKANAARNDESNQPLVRRRSFRIQGVDASSGKDLHVPSSDPDAAAAAAAKRAEDYFDADVKATAIVVTGHFNGWVASDVCKRHGIAADAASAWESSGSGSAGFSRSNPLGLTSKAAIAAAGKLSAKEIASRLLKKNPNSYFYRHVEPSESQAMGQGRLLLFIADKEFLPASALAPASAVCLLICLLCCFSCPTRLGTERDRHVSEGRPRARLWGQMGFVRKLCATKGWLSMLEFLPKLYSSSRIGIRS